MKRLLRWCTLALLPFFCLGLFAQQPSSDPVLTAMQQELDRSLGNLKKTPTPPYFLSYQLTDNRAIQISASFGALTGSTDRTTRYLDLDLRVGDYSLDNTHPMREAGGFGDASDQFERQRVPLDDNPDALRVALWHETERKYRSATQRLQKVKANVQVKVAAEDTSGDFSREGAEIYSEAIAPFSFDTAVWEQKLRKLSAPFAGHKEIIENGAEVSAEIETRRYVNSDGSKRSATASSPIRSRCRPTRPWPRCASSWRSITSAACPSRSTASCGASSPAAICASWPTTISV